MTFFAATAIVTIGVASLLAPIGLGSNVSVASYLNTVLITVVLFQIVRPLYMASGSSTRSQLGARA